MGEFIVYIFGSFWHFVGFFMIMTAIMKFICIMWNIFLRHININKHGYPPPHCDADGDFKKERKKEKEEE